ncbi:MAG: hypoxanthine phosphoribosyltransferase [Thermoanaerobaculaceae bacterium]|jgi:hypoxanthine phosphoribosyltransferase|nr:hypoxanthine phosphoribosyltransferase [Thermoanaerobaculaceae bacterium]
MLREKLIPAERLERVIATIAEELDADLEGRDAVFICVLKGAVHFFSSLTLKLHHPIVTDFIQLHSYGATTESSGTVTLVKDITVDIAGKDVYVVEDIVDTGLTLLDILALLRARHPRTVQVVALLSKPARRRVEVPVDFLGVEIEDRFVVGFGLDFAERFRNLPEIWEFAPDEEAR